MYNTCVEPALPKVGAYSSVRHSKLFHIQYVIYLTSVRLTRIVKASLLEVEGAMEISKGEIAIK